MDELTYRFLETLLETPGPSGHEGPVQHVFANAVREHADEVRHTPHGSVAAIRNPGGRPRLLIAAHADEIGLVVHHVNDAGFIHVRAVGGVEAGTALGAAVELHTAHGVVEGVVGVKPPHLAKGEDGGKARTVSSLYVDIGASSRKEAEKLVRAGDPITFRRGARRLGKDLLSSKAVDDRAGLHCVVESLRLLAAEKPSACVICLSSVGEEIGGDGAMTAAFDLEPDAAVVVDVTFASDQPDVPAGELCEVRLGKGPVLSRGPRLNESLVRLLEKCAQRARLKVQYEVLANRTGTDGDPIYRSRRGVPLAIVSLPCRYMHSPVEVVSLRDMDATSRLLASFAVELGPKSSLAPFV